MLAEVMNTASTAYQVGDALRAFDIFLGVCLWVGLTQRFWVRSKHGLLSDRVAMRVAIVSWGFLSMSSVGRDLDYLHRSIRPMLYLSLFGHIVGVAYCFVVWSVDSDRKKRQTA